MGRYWADCSDGSAGVVILPRMPKIDRIMFDPRVMGGRPCIRDARVTVGMIAGLFAAGRSEQEILEAYPYLQPEDLRAALAYAALRDGARGDQS